MTSETTGHDPLEICTLPPSDLAERLEWIRREILPHAIARERLPDGIGWSLRDVPELAIRLERLIELEADCCSSLSIEQHPGAAPGTRRLEIHGVDPDSAILQPPLDPAPAQAGLDTATGLGGRIARAAGLGTALSLLVCCVLPIGTAALIGASAAAPLATLDQPWIIAGSGLLFAGAAFVWQGRKRRARAESADSCGC